MVQWRLADHPNTVWDIERLDPQTGATTVVNHLVYDAFGRVTAETDPAVHSLFLFTARPFDSDTDLQNNLNRWYDARVGRWLSEDPIGFAAGDGNLYRYVRNGPRVAVDPAGYSLEWLFRVGGAVIRGIQLIDTSGAEARNFYKHGPGGGQTFKFQGVLTRSEGTVGTSEGGHFNPEIIVTRFREMLLPIDLPELYVRPTDALPVFQVNVYQTRSVLGIDVLWPDKLLGRFVKVGEPIPLDQLLRVQGLSLKDVFFGWTCQVDGSLSVGLGDKAWTLFTRSALGYHLYSIKVDYAMFILPLARSLEFPEYGSIGYGKESYTMSEGHRAFLICCVRG